jgi:hypothetical protein
MMQKLFFNRLFPLFMLCVLGIASITVFAQDDTVTLSKTAEYDIGFACPVASVLDPSQTEIWILMDNCFGYLHRIATYRVADGSQIDGYDYQAELAPLGLSTSDFSYSTYVDYSTNPMVFTADGDLSIHYFWYDYSDEPAELPIIGYSVLIPIASGGAVSITADSSLDVLLSQYTEYFEGAVYNQNHTQLAIGGDSAVYIIDLETETEVAEIAGNGDYFTQLRFAADGLSLQAIYLANPEDFDDNSATLYVYSLPDGELLQEYALPAYIGALSPDGTLIALHSASNDGTTSDLLVLDLATGNISPALSMYEDPTPVTTCLNTGNDVSDADFVTDGTFFTPELHWLADNRTIVAAFSYGGDGAGGGGQPCIFDYSRLRIYSVSIAG